MSTSQLYMDKTKINNTNAQIVIKLFTGGVILQNIRKKFIHDFTRATYGNLIKQPTEPLCTIYMVT